MPLLIWGGIALVGALGGSWATLQVSDAAKNISDGVDHIMKWVIIGGVAYIAYHHRGQIVKLVKG